MLSTWDHRDIIMSASPHHINNTRRNSLWYSDARSAIFASCQKHDGWSWAMFYIRRGLSVGSTVQKNIPSIKILFYMCYFCTHSSFHFCESRCPCAHFLEKEHEQSLQFNPVQFKSLISQRLSPPPLSLPPYIS